MEVNGVNSLVTDILQNILFYVQLKKETHTGLKQHEGESMMTEYSCFGRTIPLNTQLNNDSVCFITVLHGGENVYQFHPFKRIMAMPFCRWRCVHSQIYGDTALVSRETPWQSPGAMRQFVL
jgi:hypothetical protein